MDFKYQRFIEDNFLIKNKEGKIVPFILNNVQDRYMIDLVKTYGDNLTAVRDIVLKARKEGMSSLILAIFSVDFILSRHPIASVCISDTKDETRKLFNRAKFFIESYCLKRGQTLDNLCDTSNANELKNRINGAVFWIGTAGSKVALRTETVQNLHFCLSENQLVVGKNGFVTPIAKAAKQVLNGEGKYSNVEDITSKKPHTSMVRVACYGNTHFPIEVTQDHKILCKRMRTGKKEWIEASDIKKGYFIAFPTGYQIRKNADIQQAQGFVLTEDLGELIGWYLAEGSLNKSNISLVIHSNEVAHLLALLGRLKNSFTSFGVYTRSENSSEVYVFSKKLQQFIEKEFGKNDLKQIPDQVWYYPKAFVLGLLRGYFKGDGAFFADRIVLTTVCPQLAVQVKKLLISLRIGYPSVARYKPTIGGINKQGVRITGTKDIWTVTLSGKGKMNFNKKVLGLTTTPKKDKTRQSWKIGNDYAWASVTSVTKSNYKGFVYDLVLKNDPHSFTLISGVVHNSEGAHFPDTDIITARETYEGAMQMVDQGIGKIFDESTARGYGNQYQVRWELAVQGKSEFRGVFFSASALYSKEWLAKKKTQFTTNEMFLQEYPETSEEAFISSGSKFFDGGAINWLRNAITREPLISGNINYQGEII